MFDLDAFAADFAAWDASSRSGLDVHSASAGAIDLAERAEDAIAEIRRLRAEVEALEAEVEALCTPRFVDAGEGWPPNVADFLRRQQHARHGLVPWPVLTDEIEQEARAHLGMGAGDAIKVDRAASRDVFGIYDTTREPTEAP